MGAERRDLLAQFLTESLCIAAISMLIALVLLEVVVPLFNTATGRGLTIDYLTILPWLLVTTILVGLVAGAYPAYLITRASPIEAIRENRGRGAKSNRFRSVMLGLQFSISIFMLAMVLIVFLQNKKIENAGDIYPRSQIVTLRKLDVESVQQRLGTLQKELMNIPGIVNVAYSSHIPYESSSSGIRVTPVKGDESRKSMFNQIMIDENFLSTYDIPLIAGRNLSSLISGDRFKNEVSTANVLVNQLALEKLGFKSAVDAVGQFFYEFTEKEQPKTFTIAGVVPDQNFQGFHNKIKPLIFKMPELDATRARGSAIYYGSIRVGKTAMGPVLTQIQSTWDDLIPEYPAQIEFLDETFGRTFKIYSTFTVVLGGFAFIAFMLSIIGLFGLAAFMAESRTKEIGIRKVMGASVFQLVRLMIWQFSQPVIWSLLIALPLAYVGSSTYLNFFPDKIPMPAGIVAVAGILAVGCAWSIVSLQAIKIARANPVGSLRYE